MTPKRRINYDNLGLRVVESYPHTFGYSEEAKLYIAEHPHLIERLRDLAKQFLSDETLQENSDKDIAMNLVERREGGVEVFKVTIGDDAFCLKVDHKRHQAVSELKASKKLSELAALEPHIKVVPAFFGYSDREGSDYFFSKWISLPTVEKLIQDGELLPEEEKYIIELRNMLTEKLGSEFNTGEMHFGNIFWDKDEKIIWLFDQSWRYA